MGSLRFVTIMPRYHKLCRRSFHRFWRVSVFTCHRHHNLFDLFLLQQNRLKPKCVLISFLCLSSLEWHFFLFSIVHYIFKILLYDLWGFRWGISSESRGSDTRKQIVCHKRNLKNKFRCNYMISFLYAFEHISLLRLIFSWLRRC